MCIKNYFLITIMFLLSLVLFSGSVFAVPTETVNATVVFKDNPPADLKGYELKCQEENNNSTLMLVDDIQTITDNNGTSYKQSGTVEVTSGKFSCKMRAVDLTDHYSPQSQSYVVDYPPNAPIIIMITIPNITQP